MLDHVGLEVSDLARSRAFYAAALEPLGIELVIEVDGWAGFGPAGTSPEGLQHTPSFWIGARPSAKPAAITSAHVAFASRDRACVEAFWQAATGQGGRDNGAPGIRGQYHPSYFAAFVLDPDGHNVEAVCHAPA